MKFVGLVLVLVLSFAASCAHKVWVVPVESGVCERTCRKAHEGCRHVTHDVRLLVQCNEDERTCLSQ